MVWFDERQIADGECSVALTWTESDGVSDGSGVEVVQWVTVVQVKPGLLLVCNKPAISFKGADYALDDAVQQGIQLNLRRCLDGVKSEVTGFIRGVAAGWIGRKQDARYLRWHHQLHYHRHGNRITGNAHLMTVADGASCPERSPTILHCRDDGVFTGHIKVRILLTCKGHIRQVLGIG